MKKIVLERRKYTDKQKKTIKVCLGALFLLVLLCIGFCVFAFLSSSIDNRLTVFIFFGGITVAVVPPVLIISKVEKEAKFNATEEIYTVEKISEEKE